MRDNYVQFIRSIGSLWSPDYAIKFSFKNVQALVNYNHFSVRYADFPLDFSSSAIRRSPPGHVGYASVRIRGSERALHPITWDMQTHGDGHALRACLTWCGLYRCKHWDVIVFLIWMLKNIASRSRQHGDCREFPDCYATIVRKNFTPTSMDQIFIYKLYKKLYVWSFFKQNELLLDQANWNLLVAKYLLVTKCTMSVLFLTLI